MLTIKQKKWIETLSDTDIIRIFPYDVNSVQIFQSVKKELTEKFNYSILIEHHGSTRLKISGQDEIDVYIPTHEEYFDSTIDMLNKYLGSPKSNYSKNRARYLHSKLGKKIDLFVVNDRSQDWLHLNRFEEYLLANPEHLCKYDNLKLECDRMSVRAYYRIKVDFINSILAKAEKIRN